jgi:magnesium transporter
MTDTALYHLVTKVPVAKPAESVGSMITSLRGSSYESVEAVYVTDDAGKLCGTVRLADVLRLPEDVTIGEVMTETSAVVYPTEDQEHVAEMALRHNLAAVPVVNREGRLLGVVPPRSLIKILRIEHIEDLHRFTGILDGNEQARNAMEAAPVRRARDRLPWLMVGLLGSILATFIVSRFERTLQERVAIAFFVPGIVYLADAIGTQTEAITVRGLSFSNHSFRYLFTSELVTGLLIGSILGGISFPFVVIFFGDARLASVVAISICMAGGFATSIGLMLPWLLSRAGWDPAFGSGPVATIIQDVLSLMVYFFMVLLLLP